MDVINDIGSKENHLSSERAVIAFGILFIVFMVYLIYRFRECKKQDSLASYNRRGSSFTNSNNSTGSDSFDHYNPSPRAPTIFDNLNMEVSQNAGYLTTQLDLPPTYAASTHNSTENLHKNNLNVANCSDYSLPPSYDEAISHKANQNNDTDIHSRDHHREEYGHEQHDEADGSSSRRNMDRVVVTVKQNL